MPKFETTPVETITYNISRTRCGPTACRSRAPTSSTPSTSSRHGKDIYDPTGYTDIDIGDVPDAEDRRRDVQDGQDATPTGRQLFASGVGILPSHLLKGKDRNKELKDGYTWSGGPWFAKWNKGESIVLTPNPKYWGPKAHLDKVMFKFEADTAAEFQAFKSGQVDAIYPAAADRRDRRDQGGHPGRELRVQAEDRHDRSAVVQQPRRSRSTRRRCARRSATRSTATRS